MSKYTTKVTFMKKFWYCQIQYDNKPILQAKVYSREDIGPAFRSMLRTLDKCGGDRYTHAARMNHNQDNMSIRPGVWHEWIK